MEVAGSMNTHLGCGGMARGSFDVTGSRDNYPSDTPVVPRHVSIDVRVDLDAQFLEGKVTLKLQGMQPEVAEVTLDARELVVHAVEDQGRAANFSHAGGKLHVQLEPPLTLGAFRELSLIHI